MITDGDFRHLVRFHVGGSPLSAIPKAVTGAAAFTSKVGPFLVVP
jgi:hypothetical protein